ncbi:MAG: 2-dehydro-3-deoxy-phosphogluconate aldolase [Termitinemataceae bacterium]|nr:MAG: 2-dehydro-3-deoxy-phosphogluconate aldolase [Termitinemataceae bacterium]
MMMDEALAAQIGKSALVAVLVIDDAQNAVPLAKAILESGINALEITLRTPAALDAVTKIKAEVPQIIAGIGTILNKDQVNEAKKRGAAFGVAPGLNNTVLDEAKRVGLPYAPGISTASEIEAAYEKGCNVLKLFPAENLGGLKYLKNVNAPYAHLGIKYIPLGGLSIGNLKDYLENDSVLAIGGSWLAPRDLIKAKDWVQISKNCAEARAIVEQVRGK